MGSATVISSSDVVFDIRGKPSRWSGTFAAARATSVIRSRRSRGPRETGQRCEPFLSFEPVLLHTSKELLSGPKWGTRAVEPDKDLKQLLRAVGTRLKCVDRNASCEVGSVYSIENRF